MRFDYFYDNILTMCMLRAYHAWTGEGQLFLKFDVQS